MAKEFKDLFPKDLYHSYIVEGDPTVVASSLRSFLEERKDIDINSADLLFQSYDSFTMEDSQKIKEWHGERGITEGKKICIIGTKFINHDAEQTLLKIIEEPGSNTHFFIVVPNASMLLGTILSRAHVVKVNEDINTQSKDNAEDFYKSKPSARIEMVASIIEEYKDSVGSGALRSRAIELINGVEAISYKKFKSDMKNTQIQFILGELNKAREYLSTPGASVKMILEHIALVL